MPKLKLRITLTTEHLHILAEYGYVDFHTDDTEIRVRTDGTYSLNVMERSIADLLPTVPPGMVN